jgi:L-lactate permease
MWNQIYNPLGNAALSTITAAVPVVALLSMIASGKVKAHIAAIIALIIANIITIFVFTMPAGMSIRASLLGVVVGFFPIGWIVLNVHFSVPVCTENLKSDYSGDEVRKGWRVSGMTPSRCTERETGASLFKDRCVLTPL